MTIKKFFVFILSLFTIVAIYIFLHFIVMGGETIEIKDVTQKQTFKLQSNKDHRQINSINISITGHIDGSAQIHQAHKPNDIYSSKTTEKNVYVRFGGDWYSNECYIIYEPLNVKSGNLKITYRFNDI